MVCDKVCLGMVWTSSLLSRDKSQTSLDGETPREGIYDKGVSSDYKRRQIRGRSEKLSPCHLFFKCILPEIVNVPHFHILSCPQLLCCNVLCICPKP